MAKTIAEAPTVTPSKAALRLEAPESEVASVVDSTVGVAVVSAVSFVLDKAQISFVESEVTQSLCFS